MEKRWNFVKEADQEIVNQLTDELNVPNVVAKLLINRGITTFDDAKKFFRPNLEDLHDPFLMEDMEKAVQRIVAALEEDERILIYGDYDVDGTTSVTLMYSFLNDLTENIEFYQPDRYAEGYGVSMKGIEKANTNNVKLIICLDCGIKAIDQVKKANEYGIDFIICDHHRPGDELPEASAILNPKKESCNYPYKELCGCGVGFKLTQALSSHLDLDEENVFKNLDLAAIATAADIVPITGENRILTYFGLKQLNSQPRKGIQTIVELSNKDEISTVSDLVFTIAPRINAAGRMDSANKAVHLLLSTEEEDAKSWVDIINKYNSERKELDKDITEKALKMLELDEATPSKKSTVVYHSNWHKGVVGIVASRLIETHYKPTIVLSIDNGIATGSARSVKDFDIHEAISQCSDLLEKFGGHKYAAGLSLKEENLEAFAKRFEEVVSSTIPDELLLPEIKVDAKLDILDLVPDRPTDPFPKLFRLVEQFSPFGPGNMKPVFFSGNFIDEKGWSKIVGEDHLKLSVKSKTSNQLLSGIGFGLGDKLPIVESDTPFEMVFNLDKNYYNKRHTLQLMVKDLRQ